MSDRSTPRQVAAKHLSIHRRGNPSMRGPDSRDYDRADTMLAHLRHEGYVVIHPNDVPRMIGSDIPERQDGWNACRASIFRDPPDWDRLS